MGLVHLRGKKGYSDQKDFKDLEYSIHTRCRTMKKKDVCEERGTKIWLQVKWWETTNERQFEDSGQRWEKESWGQGERIRDWSSVVMIPLSCTCTCLYGQDWLKDNSRKKGTSLLESECCVSSSLPKNQEVSVDSLSCSETYSLKQESLLRRHQRWRLLLLGERICATRFPMSLSVVSFASKKTVV